eukprot:g4523.t1
MKEVQVASGKENDLAARILCAAKAAGVTGDALINFTLGYQSGMGKPSNLSLSVTGEDEKHYQSGLRAGLESSSFGGGISRGEYSQNGPVAKRIASVTPYYPFKGIDRFYDIGGFLKDPEAFQLCVDVFVERYREANIDSICGFDARGFVLGPPIALALKKPFFMLRKKGKMPNSVSGTEYGKEYAGTDVLTIPKNAVAKGDRVLLIDDLVATGGTLCAGIELVKLMGGVCVECACVVELKFLNARAKFDGLGYNEIPIWALMDESILNVDGLANLSESERKSYVDDGEAH